MRIAVLLAAKDLRQRFRDRSLLIFALLLPLGLAAIFNLTMGGAGGEETFRYALVDADRGVAARHFVDDVLRPVERQKVIRLRTSASADAARRLVDQGEVTAAIVIPQGFSSAVQNGSPTSLQIIGSVDSPIAVEVARSLAASYASELQSVRLAVATVLREGGGTDPARAQRLAQAAARTTAPLAVTDVSADRRELDTETYMSASMAVFFLFFTVSFGVSGLLQEREAGTLPRLLAAPISRLSVLGGKLLVSVIVGVVSMSMLAIATSLLLGARWGDPAGVALLVVAGVLAATGIMAVVTSLARTYEQAEQWQAVIAVTLGALGGTFFPVAQIGGALSVLTLVTPHHWFLGGLADLAGGGGVAAVLPSVAALLAFAAVTTALAVLRLRKVVGVGE